MAAQIQVKSTHVPGDRRQVVFTLVGDSSYPTGGYPYPTAAQLGLTVITSLTFGSFNFVASGTAMTVSDYVNNKTTSKVQLVTPAAVEVTAATSVIAVSVDGIAEGY